MGQVRDRSKTSALDQDRFLVKQLRRMDNIAIGREHHRTSKPLLDQL